MISEILVGATGAFIGNILSHLTERVAEAGSRKWQRILKGDEESQALERCLSAALVTMLGQMSGATTIQREQLQEIFGNFFEQRAVSYEIARLLRGKSLDQEELAEIFYDLGYDETTLPGLDFEQAMTLFEIGFLTAASQEPLLQPLIETRQLIEQTGIQPALLAEIGALVTTLRQVGSNHAQIGAGVVRISHPQLGQQQFLLAVPSDQQTLPAHDLRRAYLNYLFTTLRQLSLSGIDPAATDSKTQLQLDGVYTALLILSRERLGRVPQSEILAEQVVGEQNNASAELTELLTSPNKLLAKLDEVQVAQHDLTKQEQFLSKLQALQEELKQLRTGLERRLSALAQLNQHSHLVLMGDPGSGKSTFVNYVALCLAGEALGNEQVNLHSLTAPLPKRDGKDEDEHQPWQHGALLPVRVVLRDFAAWGLPAASQSMRANYLWEFIQEELKVAQLAAFAPHLEAILRQGDALLLLDGLDEVPEANQRRAQIKEAIIYFRQTFPRCRILVTSRTYAYQKPEWKLPDFSEAVLDSFSEGQIRRFVTSWYAHLATQKHLNQQDAQARARLLQQAIDRNERLAEFAERPLLLTLMASLHAWHGSHLPEKREELYAEAVDLLLYQWERQRMVGDQSRKESWEPSLVEWLKVDRDKVRKLLNKLAYEAHNSQPEMVGTADIPQEKLISGLLAISPDRYLNPKDLVQYLEHRAGLLLGRGEKVYTFPHRTFQEYLAACYLADRNPAEMAELARQEPNRWREVVLLAGAKVARGSKWLVWSCVDALCHTNVKKTNEPLADAWGALLAGQLLVESADLRDVSRVHQPKLKRVREWQLHILRGDTLPAVERVLAGNTLAVLGDPRFLADKWYLPDEPLLGFVEVPAGPFTMGSEDDSLKFVGSETPQHEVTLSTYWIARYPMTVAQWRVFVEESRYKASFARSVEGVANHPVNWISWHEAMAYSQWLQRKLLKEAKERLVKEVLPAEREFWLGLWLGKLTVKLPSEAEWEKAARGTDRRTYPWGEKAEPERANYEETGIGTTSSVGAFATGASPYGCEEMSGNVWEWMRTIWGESFSEPEFEYPYNPKDGREEVSDKTTKVYRVQRGGPFPSDRRLIRCAARYHGFGVHDGGWRVVVSPSTTDLSSPPRR